MSIIITNPEDFKPNQACLVPMTAMEGLRCVEMAKAAEEAGLILSGLNQTHLVFVPRAGLLCDAAASSTSKASVAIEAQALDEAKQVLFDQWSEIDLSEVLEMPREAEVVDDALQVAVFAELAKAYPFLAEPEFPWTFNGGSLALSGGALEAAFRVVLYGDGEIPEGVDLDFSVIANDPERYDETLEEAWVAMNAYLRSHGNVNHYMNRWLSELAATFACTWWSGGAETFHDIHLAQEFAGEDGGYMRKWIEVESHPDGGYTEYIAYRGERTAYDISLLRKMVYGPLNVPASYDVPTCAMVITPHMLGLSPRAAWCHTHLELYVDEAEWSSNTGFTRYTKYLQRSGYYWVSSDGTRFGTLEEFTKELFNPKAIEEFKWHSGGKNTWDYQNRKKMMEHFKHSRGGYKGSKAYKPRLMWLPDDSDSFEDFGFQWADVGAQHLWELEHIRCDLLPRDKGMKEATKQFREAIKAYGAQLQSIRPATKVEWPMQDYDWKHKKKGHFDSVTLWASEASASQETPEGFVVVADGVL